jgi:hypothetical protein
MDRTRRPGTRLIEIGLAIQALYGPRHEEIALEVENRNTAPADVTVSRTGTRRRAPR